MKRLFQIGPQYLGQGRVKFAWQPSGNLVAAVGEGQRNVFLFDRTGTEVVEEIALKTIGAPVVFLEWDPEGEMLAILQLGDPSVLLWSIATRRSDILEVSSRDPSFLAWSESCILAIGTAKGGLLLYNKRTMKKQTILGKHSKRITNGVWSPEESAHQHVLCLGSEDKNITLSKEDGDSLDQQQGRVEPEMIQFCAPCTSNRQEATAIAQQEGINRNGAEPTHVSFLQNKKSIMLLQWKEGGGLMSEVQFPEKNGQITTYAWMDGYLIVGFTTGNVVVINTQKDPSGKIAFSDEVSNFRLHQQSLNCISVSRELGKVASSCGECGEIRFLDPRSWREQKSHRIQFQPEARCSQMQWSADGQLFTFATTNGHMYCYLAKLTSLGSVYHDKLCYLTSLKEVSIVTAQNIIRGHQQPPLTLTANVEPSFISLGPFHLAAGMNNRVWFYSLETKQVVNEQEYVGTVEAVALSTNNAAVWIDGKIYLHDIQKSQNQTQIFQKKSLPPIVAGDFLVYVNVPNTIIHYSLSDGAEVNEFRHKIPIRNVYPNLTGVRAAVIDTSGNLFVYSPITDECVAVPESQQHIKGVLWDVMDSSCFLTHDGATIHVYYYVANHVGGATVRKLGESYLINRGSNAAEVAGGGGINSLSPMSIDIEKGSDGHPIPTDNRVLTFYDGQVICQTSLGSLECFRVRTHNTLVPYEHSLLEKGFLQNCALNRLEVAYALASQLRSTSMWEVLGIWCLQSLDIATAKKAYARLGTQPGMVFALDNLARNVESRQHLQGVVYQLFGNFRKAQEVWVQGGLYGIEALNMQTDLMMWNEVIPLAEAYAPFKLPTIYLQTARQQEQKGDYQNALNYYQQAKIDKQMEDKYQKKIDHHNAEVRSGLARTYLRTGDVVTGIKLANEVNSQSLYRDCAMFLEDIKHNLEAGQLYEKAENYEKAAMLYIQDMHFDAAGHLLSKIRTPKLFMQYGKAKESRQQFKEALDAYERAKDWDSVVRLLLNHLDRAPEAFQLVRETRLQYGAELISEYCRRRGDIKSAIEFLLICNNFTEAFHLASTHDEMDVFEQTLKTSVTDNQQIVEEYFQKIAEYYESRSLLSKAAAHYANCGDFMTSVRLYLKNGQEEDILAAIDVVGKARQERLTHGIIDYLMGDSTGLNATASAQNKIPNGQPKDPQYIYKLQKALGNYEQVAKTALVIAKKEQDEGNYKVVHDLLFNTFRDLQQQGLPIPLDLYKKLVLLHSYVIVRRIVKSGDHMNAAQMLLRVANNINQFPEHIVPILTSVVIESQRAGLKDDAHTYAVQLMKPENRSQISEQYKRKIEAIVRKRQAGQEEQPLPEMRACPYCNSSITCTAVDCSNCLNILPLCIYTGLFLTKDDFSQCPKCKFAARYSQITRAAEEPCPMCGQHFLSQEIEQLRDPQEMLENFRDQFKQGHLPSGGNIGTA